VSFASRLCEPSVLVLQHLCHRRRELSRKRDRDSRLTRNDARAENVAADRDAASRLPPPISTQRSRRAARGRRRCLRSSQPSANPMMKTRPRGSSAYMSIMRVIALSVRAQHRGTCPVKPPYWRLAACGLRTSGDGSGERSSPVRRSELRPSIRRSSRSHRVQRLTTCRRPSRLAIAPTSATRGVGGALYGAPRAC
jgi:hypothetical protein